MALPLETTIMAEIGLHTHYNWFNGSSCRHIRITAAERLPKEIQKHHDKGDLIAAPIPSLMSLAKRAAERCDDTYSLTRTWQIMADVIQAHCHTATDPETDYAKSTLDYWSPKVPAAPRFGSDGRILRPRSDFESDLIFRDLLEEHDEPDA